MIDPKELRIGNYVSVLHGVVKIKHFTEVGAHFEDDCGGNWRSLDPIDLTPEWLERLGFKKDPLNGYDYEVVWEYNGFSHLELMKIDIGYWAIISQRGSGKEFSRTNLRKLESVHQLQNLYYALTGKDLVLTQ